MTVLLALLQVLFLVRHAEKVDNSRDAALSQAGEARALALADKLRDAGITAIFATEFQRTQKTAAPLAKRLNVKTQVRAADDTAGLVALLNQQERALVVGHSNTLPEIAKAFGTTLEVPDEEFDGLYVLLPAERLLVRLHQ
ncbi:MAG: histidine phosphatase family protein [Deltaproteobacteria bacterium]|nr:MAG: histidine phosphatase family protein [Deltaproteobacteria bacterium]